MFTRRYVSLARMLRFSYSRLVKLLVFGGIIITLYEVFGFKNIVLPWEPLSLVGVGVSFYLGFKNNSAYDRLWEARKIWGGIINASRSWGSEVIHLLQERDNQDKEYLSQLKRRFIYRHIAWIYTLRTQLLVPTPWEHYHVRISNWKTRLMNLNEKKYPPPTQESLLSDSELDTLSHSKNKATMLVNMQVEALQMAASKKIINKHVHIKMQETLETFYDLQGKSERIKNYPLPRQYSSTSYYFVWIFVLLLPFGLLHLFENYAWVALPVYIIVGWFFLFMETVGDYGENPFEGLANDTPLLSLCKTIEIDLRQMMGEEEQLPEKPSPSEGILM